MLVNIPYMEHMGILVRRHTWTYLRHSPGRPHERLGSQRFFCRANKVVCPTVSVRRGGSLVVKGVILGATKHHLGWLSGAQWIPTFELMAYVTKLRRSRSPDAPDIVRMGGLRPRRLTIVVLVDDIPKNTSSLLRWAMELVITIGM